MNFFDPILAILVVANILPILPIVLDILQDVPRFRRRRVGLSALLTGNVVAFVFALGGGLVLEAMRARIDDLRVAGGLILLIFAIYDLLFSREQRKEPLGDLVDSEPYSTGSDVGLVPLGVPLMVGPASLTASLVVAESYGIAALAIALLVNASVNAGVLLIGDGLMDRVGHGTMRATGKVFGLLLATLAVAMVRVGVTNMWQAAG